MGDRLERSTCWAAGLNRSAASAASAPARASTTCEAVTCGNRYASRAQALGRSRPVIDKLLGHSQIQTTARYAHLARDSVKASAAQVAASIAGNFLHGDGSALERSSER